MKDNKLKINIFTNLLLQIITIVYGFLVPFIIIRRFGSEVNGLISSITQFLGYIALLESGFGPVIKAAFYKPIIKKDKEQIKQILKTSERFFRKIASIFIIYIAVLIIVYPLLINTTFSVVYTASLILIIAISTFSEYFFGITYRLFLQSDQKNYIVSLVQTVTYVVSALLIAAMTIMNFNIHCIKLISGIVFVIRPLILNLYVKRHYDINNLDNVQEIELEQKWDGLSHHIASVIHTNTDITIITLFCKITEVSVYSVYYLVVKGVKLLVQSFLSSVDAKFGKLIAQNKNEELNISFSKYEKVYLSIVTIAFSCCLVLITPFITIYTNGVTDVNYNRPLFGYLLVISEYIWAIRQPYNELVKAACKFRETKIGGWIEAIVNIVLSIVLVIKYGIVGVAIGTIVAMTIRTIEFMYFCSHNILKRKNSVLISNALFVILGTVIITITYELIPKFEYNSYFNWILNGGITFSLSLLIVGALYYIRRKKYEK